MAIQYDLITENQMGSQQHKLRAIKGGAEKPHAPVNAAPALELIHLLQTTLELDELLNVFGQHVRNSVAQDGLVYRHPDLGLEIPVGGRARHTCVYRLLIAGENLGELEFSRRQRFTEQDAITLEYCLSALLYPLRNALLYRKAVQASLKDPLTGVNNRASFENTLRRETDLAHRHGTSLSMILMDIDNFKDINDRFGHLIGDCVLREVAQCAAGCVRSSDMVFRYGGEEFAIILSNTEIHGAELLAERIRRTVQRLCCNYGETSITVTASMGVATLVENDVDQGLLQRADRALYQAKGNGRNRVAVLEHTS